MAPTQDKTQRIVRLHSDDRHRESKHYSFFSLVLNLFLL
jgi:hypothetical protein